MWLDHWCLSQRRNKFLISLTRDGGTTQNQAPAGLPARVKELSSWMFAFQRDISQVLEKTVLGGRRLHIQCAEKIVITASFLK